MKLLKNENEAGFNRGGWHFEINRASYFGIPYGKEYVVKHGVTLKLCTGLTVADKRIVNIIFYGGNSIFKLFKKNASSVPGYSQNNKKLIFFPPPNCTSLTWILASVSLVL